MKTAAPEVRGMKDGSKVYEAEANVIVNSSGIGNVRSDVESEIRRVQGTKRGEPGEVTVAFLPGKQPAPLPEDTTADIHARMAESIKAAARAMFGDGPPIPPEIIKPVK